MELIAGLIGCNLEPSIGGSMEVPEIHLRLGHHGAAGLDIQPRLAVINDERVFIIEIKVSWSASHYTPQEAAYLASLHVIAAQKAAIAESVAHGRKWLAAEVFPDE